VEEVRKRGDDRVLAEGHEMPHLERLPGALPEVRSRSSGGQ
jgi:hypothetical protein